MVLTIVLVVMTVKKSNWHYSIDIVRKYGYTLDAIFWATLMGFFLSGGQHFMKRILIRQADDRSWQIFLWHVHISLAGIYHYFQAIYI